MHGRGDAGIPGRIIVDGDIPSYWHVRNLRDSPRRHVEAKTHNSLTRADFQAGQGNGHESPGPGHGIGEHSALRSNEEQGRRYSCR